MGAQANVTSVEALETFRSSIIVFTSKAASAVDQVADAIRQIRGWVQHEQRRHWESEVKKRDRLLGQAKQDLMSVKMIGMLQNFSAQQAAVRKARAALEEAEIKLRNVKRWTRDFDAVAEPLVKSLENFRGVLGRDLPEATAFLTQAQITLAAYRETHAFRPGSPAAESPLEETQPSEAP